MLFFVLYQVFQLFCLPLIIPYVVIKNLSAQGTLTEHVGNIPTADRSKNVIWIHGLSQGEILSVQELVKKIKQDIPNAACYITAGTEEGKKVAAQQLGADYVSMMPHDDALAMALAFDRIRPKGIILLEHEIKPTLIMLAKFRSIPVYLLNAQYTSQTVTNLESFNYLYQPRI